MVGISKTKAYRLTSAARELPTKEDAEKYGSLTQFEFAYGLRRARTPRCTPVSA